MRYFFVLSLLLLGFNHAFSQTKDGSVAVIEIANFYCPHCYEAQQYVPALEAKLKETGGQFDLVPIYWGDISPWPTRLYLSLPKELNNSLAQQLFMAAQGQGLTMKTAESTCTAVKNVNSAMSLQECVNLAKSNRGLRREYRAWQLISHIPKMTNIQLPLFIIEKNGKIVSVYSRSDYGEVSELVKAVTDAI